MNEHEEMVMNVGKQLTKEERIVVIEMFKKIDELNKIFGEFFVTRTLRKTDCLMKNEGLYGNDKPSFYSEKPLN